MHSKQYRNNKTKLFESHELMHISYSTLISLRKSITKITTPIVFSMFHVHKHYISNINLLH